MSEVIGAIESFLRSPKGNGVTFNASDRSFDFNFIYKPKISFDSLLSKVEVISDHWKYDEKLDVPITFKQKPTYKPVFSA